MSPNQNPTQLNLQVLAAASGCVEGGLARADSGIDLDSRFSRLAAEACVPQGLVHVSWRACAELREVGSGEPQVWLHLAVTAALPMVCQRCLTPTQVDIASAHWFRFVADEATAEAEDDVSDEDVLVLAPRFDLLGLVEDELLMSLPLVPMHAECPVAVVTRMADPDFVETPVERIHPFADLKLKLAQKEN